MLPHDGLFSTNTDQLMRKLSLFHPLFVRFFLFFLFAALTACDPAPIPAPVTSPPAESAYETLTAVTTTTLPERDMVALVSGLQGADLSPYAQTDLTHFQPGDRDNFWYKETGSGKNIQIEAELRYQSDALNLWFEEGLQPRPEDVANAAARLEDAILPTNRAFFGAEWQPGVDGDNRVNILHLKELGHIGVAYFWSGDELPVSINPTSNQREMLYVSLKDAKLGSDNYFQAIAHELQHLIQWRVDKNEDGWLNEGMAELAAHVNGFSINRVDDYVSHTDTQLTTLSHDPHEIAAHYAHSFFFTAYLLDRFGEEATHALVQHSASGPQGITAVLQELGTGLTFDDLFADWLVASILQSFGRGEGLYAYQSIELAKFKPYKLGNLSTPRAAAETVHQYGADYFTLHTTNPVTVVFTGTQQIPLFPTRPPSGEFFYASLPADESALSLTRPFDLSGLEEATLTFQTWYDIEEGWDYAYVMGSGDNGRSWQILPATSTTLDNPQGSSLGPGFTGKSGGGVDPIWQKETVDLSPIAGRSILLRFLSVTDGALTEAGFLIDDIAIPELGFLDDAEQENGWASAGIVRASNTLPASFIVQRILIGADGVQVERLPLDENNRGEWRFPMDRNYDEAILIIAGNTPVSRAESPYEFVIIPEASRR